MRPQSVVALKNVTFTSEGGSGSGNVSIVSGSASPTDVTLDGLSKADSSAIELVPGPFRYESDASNFIKTVEVPAGHRWQNCPSFPQMKTLTSIWWSAACRTPPFQNRACSRSSDGAS